jgi:HSP20 family molecular chaperone IbpA
MAEFLKDKIEATCNDGVLNIVLPKNDAAKML